MTPTTSSHRAFIIEIVPAAWQQVVSLSFDMYLALQERLHLLAELAFAEQQPAPASMSEAREYRPMSFVMGDLSAHYEVDHPTRAIRLLGVTRRPPAVTSTATSAPSAPLG